MQRSGCEENTVLTIVTYDSAITAQEGDFEALDTVL